MSFKITKILVSKMSKEFQQICKKELTRQLKNYKYKSKNDRDNIKQVIINLKYLEMRWKRF